MSTSQTAVTAIGRETTYSCAASGTSGCRNVCTGCATWSDAYRYQASASCFQYERVKLTRMEYPVNWWKPDQITRRTFRQPISCLCPFCSHTFVCKVSAHTRTRDPTQGTNHFKSLLLVLTDRERLKVATTRPRTSATQFRGLEGLSSFSPPLGVFIYNTECGTLGLYH